MGDGTHMRQVDRKIELNSRMQDGVNVPKSDDFQAKLLMQI
jgi:hypothetical protein